MSREDALGDRMRRAENAAERVMDWNNTVVARLDGRAFGRWTEGLAKPFDHRMHEAMGDAALAAADEVGACYVYTQSDEVTFVIAGYMDGPRGSARPGTPFLGNRLQKTVSLLASIFTGEFNAALLRRGVVDAVTGCPKRPAAFDCRVRSVADRAGALDVIRWRERDAERNSVSQIAMHHAEPEEMTGVSTEQRRAFLRRIGEPWEDAPEAQRYGSAWHRETVTTPFTAAEMDALPPKHAARNNPSLMVTRARMVQVPTPLCRRYANAEAVVFDRAVPVPRGDPDAPWESFSDRVDFGRS